MNIRGYNTSELPTLLITQKPQIVTPGTAGDVTIKDAYISQSTTATTNNNVQLLAASPLTINGPVTYTSNNPTIATVNSTGLTQWIANGSATVLCVTASGTVAYTYSASQSGGQTTQSFLNFVVGSLAAAFSNSVTAALSGAAPSSTNQKMWSAATNPTAYTWNSSRVLATTDTTCISPWNSSGGPRQAGTLITPQDAVLANHYQYGIGTIVYYVGSDGNVYSGTVSAKYNVPNTDIFLVHFSSPINSLVTPATILPSTWTTYLPSIQYGIPCFWVPQSKLIQAGMFSADVSNLSYVNEAVTGQNANWWVNTNGALGPISGDSGSPVFFSLGGKTVLLCTWWFGGGAGPMLSDNIAGINTGLSAMGSSHTVTTTPLTGYPTY